MAQLILCWQQQIQYKVDTFVKKKKNNNLLEHGHYRYWHKHKLVVVLEQSALLSESFSFSDMHTLLPAVLWHSYFPIFKNTGKKPSQLYYSIHCGTYLPISQITSYRDFLFAGFTWCELMKKDIIYKYIRATMTRSGPQSTSYMM